MMIRAFTLATFAVYASAQSLSSQCTGALTSIAANKDAAACLSPGSLIPIIASGNASIIAPINNWLTSLCAAAPCSNDTISAVVANITSGCSSDLGSTNSSDMSASLTTLVQQYYPTVRKVVCLKDGSTNCITQTLTNVESVVGTLSISNILSIISGTFDSSTDLPANITCTNCVKAAYNVINTDIPSLTADSAAAIQSECGASFTDGTTPSGISQSASTASPGSTTTKNSGAFGFSTHSVFAGMSASALIVISTAFAFLA